MPSKKTIQRIYTIIIFFIGALFISMVFPKYATSAMGEAVKPTRTPSNTSTFTPTVTNTPTITSTPTITPTPTDRPGTHLPQTNNLLELQIPDEFIGPISYSPDNKLFAVGYDGGIRIFDTRDYSLKKRIILAYKVDVLAFSPDSKMLAAASHYSGNSANAAYITNIWETSKWNLLSSVQDGRGLITGIVWDPTSHIFVTARDTVDKNKSALFFWYTNGVALASLESPAIASMAISKDGNELYVGGKDGYVYVYGFNSYLLKYRIKVGNTSLVGLSVFKPDWICSRPEEWLPFCSKER